MQLILVWMLLVWPAIAYIGCGRQSERDVVTVQADPEFAAVQPLVAKNCGGCHGVQPGIPVFATGAAFRASKALSEIEGGDMPPAGHLDAGDKAKLVAYLHGT